MSSIRELLPPVNLPRPRCEHEIVDEGSRSYRAFHKKDSRCDRQSSYEIKGKYFCGQHAGVVALKLLMSYEVDGTGQS